MSTGTIDGSISKEKRPPVNCNRRPFLSPAEMLELERNANAELNGPLGESLTAGAVHAGDLGISAKAADGSVWIQLHIRNVGAGVAEVGGVAEVERVGADLHLPAFVDGDLAEEAEIHVQESGTAHRVETGGAEAGIGDRDKGQRVKVRRSGAVTAEDGDVGLNLVGALR